MSYNITQNRKRMAAIKDSFIFYKDWANVIKDLPAEIRLDVYDAVIEYAISGKLSDLKPMAKIAFGFIKQTIDRDTEKYSKISQIRSESGKVGAIKKWQMIANDSKNSKCHPNDNDNDNDFTPPYPNGYVPPLKAPPDLEFRKEKFMNECAKFIETYEKQMLREFFDYWTEANKSKTKMRFELEKTWDLARRLGTWNRNDKNFRNGNHKKSNQITDEELMQSIASGIARSRAEKERQNQSE